MIDPPTPASGFRWVTAPWGLQLTADALEAFRHGWTTRQLQLRGSAEVEAAGWAEVAAAVGVAPDELVRLRQVHGAAVYRADHQPGAPAFPEADAAISRDRSRALTVQVADCVPLLLGDASSGTVGVAHAGWRGTMADVAGAVVSELRRSEDVCAADLHAAIGPSIGPCCYAVGAELREKFHAAGWSADEIEPWFDERSGVWYLDLWRANADQLVRTGVPCGAVHISRLCTFCHADWFPSYRRDGVGAGRVAGYISAKWEVRSAK